MTVIDADTGESITIAGVHPIAEMFPMLDADDLKGLADDIASQGVLEPVTVDPDGQLLDGRNRLAAAKKAKATVPCVTYSGDPVAFILGKNMARRDMTKGQKAMIVAQAVAVSPRNMRQEAVLNGVSAASIAKGSTVLSHAPELVEQVVAAKRTLDDAYKVAKANKAAAEKEEAVLAQLEQDAPDLAAKVASGDLQLGEAKALHDRRLKEAEQAAVDRTRLFSECVVKLGATLDVGDVSDTVDALVKGWRQDAVRITDPNDWLTAEGLNRVARCLVLVSEQWENRNG